MPAIRFQFSLRTLLAAVTVTAVACAWLPLSKSLGIVVALAVAAKNLRLTEGHLHVYQAKF
jgi:hypothetical protein